MSETGLNLNTDTTNSVSVTEEYVNEIHMPHAQWTFFRHSEGKSHVIFKETNSGVLIQLLNFCKPPFFLYESIALNKLVCYTIDM